MIRYIAFLRAINVAGHSKVKMSDLKQAFIAAGCKNVITYIQSGNVIFETPAAEAESRKRKIHKKLQKLLGEEVAVMYRTHLELKRIVRAAPFKELASDPDIKLYVAFLAKKPHSKRAYPLQNPKEALEAVALKNLEIYIISRKKKNGGYGFPNNFIEKELGVTATSRNWSTVTRVARLLDES
jgi:uncharacterized protein (DUF1697 family)